MLTAYDVVLDNVLPNGLDNVTAITVTAATGGAETPTFTNNGGDWASNPFDVPVGALVTITFMTELTDTMTFYERVINFGHKVIGAYCTFPNLLLKYVYV